MNLVAYYVYIIQSENNGSFYKGFSENPQERLLQHNSGLSKYTSAKMPWKLLYIEESPSKRDALIREKSLKKYSHAQIERLIKSSRNILTSDG